MTGGPDASMRSMPNELLSENNSEFNEARTWRTRASRLDSPRS